MKGKERADRLLEEARESRNEAYAALKQRSWDLTIGRTQRVVVLALKALLAEMGAEHHSDHDLGSHFSRRARATGIEVEEATLGSLEVICRRSATRRASGLFHEVAHGEAGALEAVADAETVMGFAVDFLRRLRAGEGEPGTSSPTRRTRGSGFF